MKLKKNHKEKAISSEIKDKMTRRRPAGTNLCGLEPQLIKLEFIIYLPKLKVSGGPIVVGLGALYALDLHRKQGPLGAHFLMINTKRNYIWGLFS